MSARDLAINSIAEMMTSLADQIVTDDLDDRGAAEQIVDELVENDLLGDHQRAQRIKRLATVGMDVHPDLAHFFFAAIVYEVTEGKRGKTIRHVIDDPRLSVALRALNVHAPDLWDKDLEL